MTTNTLEERKEYINKVKESFQNPGTSIYYRDVGEPAPEEKENVCSRAFQWRFWIAVILFVIFVYCDKNQIKIYQYTTEEVEKILKGNMEQVTEGVYEWFDK